MCLAHIHYVFVILRKEGNNSIESVYCTTSENQQQEEWMERRKISETFGNL